MSITRQIISLLILITLNLADVATTLYGLQLGGHELNPFFQLSQLPIKIALPFLYAFLFLFTFHFCNTHEFTIGLKTLNITLIILIILYVLVVANNLIGIIKVKGQW